MLSSRPLVLCFAICRHDTSQANGGTIAHPQHQRALNALNNSFGRALNVPSSASPLMPSTHPKRALNAPPTRPQRALSAPSQCTSVPCPSCLPSVHASFWMRYSFLRVVLGCDLTPLVPFCLVMGRLLPLMPVTLLVLHVVLGQHVTRSLPRVIIAHFLSHVVVACRLPCVVIAHHASSSRLVIAHHLPRVVIACRLLRVVIGRPFRASSLSHTRDPSFCTLMHCMRSCLGRGCKSPLAPHACVWGEGDSRP